MPPSTDNIRGSIGFNVQHDSGTTGQAVYAFRGTDGYQYVVKTNSWRDGTLSFGHNTVFFRAKCNVTVLDPATGTRVDQLGGDNFSCRVDATDIGRPNTNDTVAASIYTGTGDLYYQVGTPASPLPLRGGNVIVHTPWMRTESHDHG